MKLSRFNHRAPDLFEELSQLHRELDQMFDLNPSRMSPFRTFGLLEGEWSPLVDIYEDKDNVRVRAELPGLKKEDIELSVRGETLILKGERKRNFDEEKDHFHRVERIYGQFHRTVILPSPVETNGIKAVYKDGILDVVLPKKEEAKPKQIQVETK